MHKIFKHGLPKPFAPSLWEVQGTLAFPLVRKMVIHRFADGTLLLHSVVAMDDEGMRALDALGEPAVMVVPHTMHTLDAPFYAKRYPKMKIVAPRDIADKLTGKVKVDAAPDELLPELGVHSHMVPGLKWTEVVLDVATGAPDGGRALLFTDVVGHGKPKGLMMRLLGPPGGSGVARIVKLRQVGDKGKLRTFLRTLSDTPKLEAVMGSHSEPVTEGPSAFLRNAADGI